jgi:hypothetical protein
MECPSCGSGNQVELQSEMAIHFSGRKNLDKPHVFVSPPVLICLDCGLSSFTLTETELQKLRSGHAGPETAL